MSLVISITPSVKNSQCTYGPRIGLDRSVLTRTKCKIACFAGPSFQDGSTPLDVCAGAETGRSGPHNAGSNASIESRTRRLTPEEGAIEFIFDFDAV